MFPAYDREGSSSGVDSIGLRGLKPPSHQNDIKGPTEPVA